MTDSLTWRDSYTMPDHGDNLDLVETLLANRGIDAGDKDTFLHPVWEHNHDPLEMHNMAAVVDRLWNAIANNESLVVYSDYDADGVPGAVVLTDFFKKIGFESYRVYIPNRNIEGFGLNTTACEQFIGDQVDVLITIDCGIADLDCIAQLQQGGVEVIVTDHHLPSPDGLPDCLILDPQQPDCNYPFPELCGSGVIFKLVQAMLADTEKIGLLNYPISKGWEKWLLDMVGVATICDMVPLVGENRIFAHYGLRVLRKSPRSGLQKLLQLGRAQQSMLTTQDVGFTIGPRINAASRIADPMIAFQALSETGPNGIAAAEDLEKLNRKRKTLTATAARAAYKKIDAMPDGPVIVVGDTDWPLGIVGLIAGNIADRYGKPAFVWTRVGDVYKGSVRSGGTCSINELMKTCAPDTFVSFGGHDAAGGFVCDDSGIHVLPERLNDAWDRCPSYTREKKLLDATISIDQVNRDNWDVIRALEPYGIDNPAPLFVLEDIRVDAVRTFGKDSNHLSLSFRNTQGIVVNAIRFNHQSAGIEPPAQGAQITLVVAMEMNTYNGASELRLRIEDLFV